MADLLDFIPPFAESIDKIRARLNADLNTGLSPTDPGYVDTTPGGFIWDLTQAPGLEIERLYESLNEAAAVAFPQYAWGTYLDEHALVIGLVRNDSVAATGVVTFSGPAGTFIPTGTEVATVQATPDAEPLVYSTLAEATLPAGAGTQVVDIAVQAEVRGTDHNVPAGAVTVLLSPIAGITAVTNAGAITGGAEVESDESLLNRILLEWSGAHGSGNIADYEGWALAYPGVGFVRVNPLASGPGTVTVVITDVDNNPVSGTVIAGLQAVLDPVAGQGRGLAPIGAVVTVATATTLTVNVAAHCFFVLSAGYTLDGTGGTIAVRADIVASVKDYINHLKPGEKVILQEVVARIMSVTGVYDVDTVTLNGSAANLTVTSLQVPRTGTITLTETDL